MKKIFQVSLLTLFTMCSTQSLKAQNVAVSMQGKKCGTSLLPYEYELWLQQKIVEMKNNPNAKVQQIYTLPVVFHIIHNGSAVGSGSNISNAKIQSQIAILNQDFRKLNADTNNIPGVWKGIAADCAINFCLAQKDINGNTMATPGINRINRNTKGFTAPPYDPYYFDDTIKPATIWNPNNYLNIWISDLSFVFGYATYPANSTLPDLPPSPYYGTMTTDGIVLRYNTVGSLQRRVATHELGHWLGLRHIWGDSSCGNDYCNDTPSQMDATQGCPTSPFLSGCSGNAPNGDMFMNYMDYSSSSTGSCMCMFTNDQKTRMHAVMANSPFRVNLALSTACPVPSGIVENDSGIDFSIYPNPTTGLVTINMEHPTRNLEILIINYLGQTVYSEKLSDITGSREINLSNQGTGIYLVRLNSEMRTVNKQLIIGHN